MLSTCLMRNQIFINKSLHDYCRKSTEESIRKITEKHYLERNSPKIKNPLDDDNGNNNPKFNFNTFLIFLSVTMVSFYFYKRLK